jgi:hypothetical protein
MSAYNFCTDIIHFVSAWTYGRWGIWGVFLCYLLIMKKIIFSMFLLGTLIGVNAQVPSYVPKDSLKSWWPFNSNSNDESGNGNAGTLKGIALNADRFGVNNKAISITNSAQIMCTKNKISNPSTFAISLWFKTNSTTPSKLFGFNDGQCKHIFRQDRHLGISSNGKLEFHINRSSGNVYLYSNTVCNDNKWHHCVYMLSPNGMEIYIDGKLDAKNSNSIVTAYDGYWRVGGLDSADMSVPSTIGLVDDIGIWNRVLTPSEISELYISCSLTISTEPTNQSSSINNQVQFSSLASDTTASYQWQSNHANMGWSNIPSNSFYSGVTSKKLTVSNVQVNNHKQLFRVIATKNTCKDTSAVAMLTVNDTCIFSTTDTLFIKVNTNTVNNPVYNTIKVYPNPSSTQVIIDNGNYSSMGSYTAKIVNASGQQVFQSVINQQQFTIDAATMGGAGVYTLYITDSTNKVVGTKKIVLQ